MSTNTILNYPKSIGAIAISVLADSDVPKLATVRVATIEQFKDRKPVSYGLYDPAMGTTNLNCPCGTCGKFVDKCPGHIGYYVLNYPKVHPLYNKFITKNMNIICHRCYRYVMNPRLQDENGLIYADHPMYQCKPGELPQYDEVINYIHDKKTGKHSRANYCDYCNRLDNYISTVGLKNFTPYRIQPLYKQARVGENDEDYNHFLTLEERSEYDTTRKTYVPNTRMKNINEYSVLYFPRDCKERFEMMPDSELALHGIAPDSHPKNFIFTNMVIPPSNLRHVNRRKNDTYNNFMTSALESIIKADQLIDKSVTFHDVAQYTKQLKHAARASFLYYEYTVASSNDEKEISSINSSIKGKYGLMRSRCLGKLISKVFRCVIACNVGNDLDVANIPRNFSTIINFKETVTPYNIKRLQTYVNNKDRYPGCSKIRINDGARRRIKINDGTYKLKPGDVVYRNIIDNDTIPITRFPSLFTTSTINMRVVIPENRDNNSVGLNVTTTCAALNGDFDGDTVSCFQNTSEDARAQFDILGNIERNFTSGIDGSAIYGQAQDTIAACGYLTMDSTKLNIMQVKQVLNGVPINIKLENRIYSGRELFSMVMPRIELEAASPFFKNPFVEKLGNFSEADKVVRIKDGKLISGIVCDSLIKIGKKNTIYHIIYNYYGAKKALEVIRNHQVMMQNFLKLYGMSLDYSSFLLGDNSREMIRLVQSSLLYNIERINRMLMNKEIVPPSGVKLYDHVENMIIKEIRSMSGKYIGPVLSGTDINKNWLVQMWLLGSKGSFDNIEKMLVTIGQVYLDSRRSPFLLDYLRTNIWSQQFSLDPVSRGYVEKSYFEGYDLRNIYSLSREARNNIITKGLVTSDGGTEGRNMIMTSNSLVVDNRMFISRSGGTKILQLTACDDGIDHKNLFPSKYVLFNKPDSYIHDNYPVAMHNSLIDERNEYIIMSIQKEKSNLSFTSNDSVLSPLNMPQIINIILGDSFSEFSGGSDYDFDYDSHDHGEDSYERSQRLGYDAYKPVEELLGGAKAGVGQLTDKLADQVNGYCDTLFHKRFNKLFIEHVNKTGKVIPDVFKYQFAVMRIVIRSSFNNDVMKRIMGTPNPKLSLDTVLAKVTHQILINFVEPGLAYGINVSLTLTSPFTQYLIDAHHSSASGGTSRDNIRQFKTIVYLKPNESMHFRKTCVFMLPEYETNRDNVVRLANFIETQHMNDYAKEIRMLCEDPGTFTTYPEDASDVKKSFAALDVKVTNMHNFIFRIVMNKTKMIPKGVSITNTIIKLESVFGGIRCGYRETATEYIVYMLFGDQFSFDLPTKRGKGKGKVISFMKRMEIFAKYIKYDFIINDIKDLSNIEVKPLKRNYIENGLLVTKTIYYIEADGINLTDIYLINVVDKTRTFCNSIQDMFLYCGYMEARCRIIDLLNSLFKDELGLLITNYVLFADIMMELGYPMGLTTLGLANREKEDPLVVAAYKNPLDALCDAATNATLDKLTSPTSNLIAGQVINFGTRYNETIRNPEMTSAVVNDEDIL